MAEQNKALQESNRLNCKRIHELPKMITRFKYQRNPLDEEYGQDVIDAFTNWWIDYIPMSKKRYKRHVANASLQFCTYFYCFTNSVQRYEYIIKFFNFFGITDEIFDNNPGHQLIDAEYKAIIYEQLMTGITYLDGGSGNIDMVRWKPYVLASFATGFTIVNDMNDIQRKRFLYYWRQYLQSTYEENLLDNPSTTLDQILKLRMGSIGGYPAILLVEYGMELFITDSEFSGPEMTALMEAANKAIIFYNDIISFEKELKEFGDDIQLFYKHNTVAYFVFTQQTSIYEAMEMTNKLLVDMESELDTIAELINQNECFSENVKSFVKGVKYLVGGHWIASLLSIRYHDMTPSINV